MNEYYMCKSCGQVVQGWHASRQIECCSHPDYVKVGRKGGGSVVGQEITGGDKLTITSDCAAIAYDGSGVKIQRGQKVTFLSCCPFSLAEDGVQVDIDIPDRQLWYIVPANAVSGF